VKKFVFSEIKKNIPKNKKPPKQAVFAIAQKNYAQDFCEAGAFFALAASFLRLM
jgi:hypothetical protein